MRGRRSINVLLFAMMQVGWRDLARAQTPAERQAAKETYIEGLRLLDAAAQEPRLTALGAHLGYVETDARPGGGKYLCGALSRDQGRTAGKIVGTALSKLPDPALRKLRLRYVILCGVARADGRRIGGIPVPPLDLLMLDVGASGSDPARLQYTALHELYHLIEFRFNTYQDADWQKLFGTGYANSYTERAQPAAAGSGKRGFLNAYAETYPHEDRAELFAALLLNPAQVVAQITARKDDVLKQKALYLDRKSERLLGLRLTPPGL